MDCAALGIDCPKAELLSDQLNDLLKFHPESVVKLIVTRGEGTRGYAPAASSEPTIIWDISPLPDYPAERATNGIKARLCQLRLSDRPHLAGVKHLNRLENVLAASEWNDPEISEGLLMNTDNDVIEGTRSNLFLVSRGLLITPDLARCGVAGVQRDRVMAWAVQYDMPMQVRNVSLDEVFQAEELFVVNSIAGLWPLSELENCHWTNFPISTKIRQSLEQEDA
jgi:4-amino-4-deoxychorismate lyase